MLKQCVRVCLKLDLITANVLFVDGTKIRANAARGQTYDRACCEKVLAELDQRIEKLMEESEREGEVTLKTPSLTLPREGGENKCRRTLWKIMPWQLST